MTKNNITTIFFVSNFFTAFPKDEKYTYVSA